MLKIKASTRLIISSLGILLGLTACSTMPGQSHTTTTSLRDGAPSYAVDVSNLKNASPKYEPKSAYGNPPSYMAEGKRYYVMDSAKGYSKVGIASWYGTKFHGKLTSSHEPYDMLAMTAASPTLPIPTYVRVTNLENNRQVIVKVNDRGPFANDRIMDLSYAAAKKLGYTNKGTAKVKVEALTFDEPGVKNSTMLANNPPAHSKQMYLQIGAFQQMEKAQKVKIQLAQLTHQSIRIDTLTLKEKTLYRVQIGPLRDWENSNLVAKLQQQGYSKPIRVFS